LDDVERIAQEVLRRLRGDAAVGRGGPTPAIPVTVSARHVHVTRGVLDTLFGERHELTKLRDLGQPGEFACVECVTIVGASMRAIESVRLLGPVRSYTQVEISRTDGVRLGIDPPARKSGDVAGSAPITVAGPRGTVVLREGAIRATRHIHMTGRDAEVHGVRDGDLVRVRFPGPKALTFENVLIRVAKAAALELHLDTDDANAADVRLPMSVDIVR
jgi:putative phosphotransacetylase